MNISDASKFLQNNFNTISLLFFGGIEIKILFDEFKSFSKFLSNSLFLKLDYFFKT